MILRDYIVPEEYLQLDAIIGRGSFGIVFRGKLGKQDVCIKVPGTVSTY